MGVNGLWQVLQPCARPTNLATLNRKRLAVDASIWIYQFLKAVRDKEGHALRNSHIVGFFRRICKLLWFGILPVFVFDGGAPMLKRSTLQARRQRREGRREDAVRTAGKLLTVQMQRLAEEEVGKERRKRSSAAEAEAETEAATAKGSDPHDGMVTGEFLPSAEKIVYAQEMHLPQHKRLQARKFSKQDAYHLPELEHGNSFEGMGRPDDPRIMNIAELEEYARQFNAGEDINLYDFSKIDFDGDFFCSLPPVDRYNILNAARLRSRLRMGLSKEQLDSMFPDRMAFSRFQIERVRERNHLTQRLMIEAGMSGIDLTMGLNARVAGERDREYILVKNEGAEGGWALGVVSREKDHGQVHKPIDVDAMHYSYLGDDDDKNGVTNEIGDGDGDEDEDIEFQDVPIEGLNRLPRLQIQAHDTAFFKKTTDKNEFQDEDSLFVTSYEPANSATKPLHNGFVANVFSEDDEDADLKRAIAMSIQSQRGARGAENEADEADEGEDEETFEEVDISAPEWTQKRAPDVTRPILAASGRTVAHIVNNRYNAAMGAAAEGASSRVQQDGRLKIVPKDVDSDSSDSELDIRTIMANTARAKKSMAAASAGLAPAPAPAPAKKKFDGPLPFEKLDWRSSIFEKRPPTATMAAIASTLQSQNRPQESDRLFASLAPHDDTGKTRTADEKETDSLEPVSEPELDDLAGGFVKIPERTIADQDDEKLNCHVESSGGGSGVQQDTAPRPLPPWMMDNTDIRTAIRQQQAFDKEINAEDRAMALEEEQIWQRRMEEQVVKIDSSDDDNDIEVLEAPTSPPLPLPKSLLNLDRDASKNSTLKVHVKEMVKVIEPVELDGAEAMEDKVQYQEKGVAYEKNDTRASPDMDFEDLVLPSRPSAIVDKEAGVERQSHDDFLFAGRDGGDDGFHEFSDPEDEELLAQMAEEVEEHARFASTLNSKTSWENQEAYERELKALRSQQKRDRRDADEVTQIMVSECQALLRLFGIPYITAPMEAEAQCAELVALGLVDGIVTDDSDTFLFGGTRVYKNMFNSNKFVECYLSADLERELSLSRDSLIAMAQLLGSDYAEGLSGVGPVTAMEILSEFPAGSGQQGLCVFRDWWEDVQKHGRSKEDDAASPFRRKFRKAHFTKLFLAPGFPSTAVVDAYLKPEVDRSAEPFQWGAPDLGGLRSFLMATIGWTQERTDEVLVPVIRDMNRRETEGTQSNITRFFSGTVGTGARLTEEQQLWQQQPPASLLQDNNYAPRHAPRAKASAGSRRMAAAVSRLKSKTAGIDSEGMDAASAAAAVMSASPATTTGGRKRKPLGIKNMMTTKKATGSKRKPEVSSTVSGGGESGKGSGNVVAGDVSESGEGTESSFDEGRTKTRRRRSAKKTKK